MTSQEFAKVVKSIEVDICEYGKDNISVLLKGRFIDEREKEYGFLRRIPFLKCPVKGKKGKKAWVHEMYEGRQVYDARFGGVRVVQR